MIKLSETSTTLATALVALAGSAQAALITSNDFDSATANSTGTLPDGFTFFGSGGDMPGGGANQGVSDANPRSGSFSYVIDHSHATPGAGWGATWLGVTTNDGNFGLTTKDDAIANGTSANPLTYVDIVPGLEVTMSAWVATDSLDPAVNDGHVNIHFELVDAGGGQPFRTDNASGGNTAPSHNWASLTDTYQELTHTHTFTAADIALAADPSHIAAVISTNLGTGGAGADSADGLIYVDDFTFSVSDAHLITIPEPGTAALALLGLLGVVARRRR